MSVNKVILVGRVGQDPEIRYTSSGDPVINLSLATSETWKNKAGEKQEATEWHRVNFFGKPAEIINQYVRKGSQLYVEGKIKTKKYTDKQGVEKYAFEIQCDLFKLIGSKPDDAPKQAPKEAAPIYDDMNDKIPF
jgi:single-strand DNA-binding protein